MEISWKQVETSVLKLLSKINSAEVPTRYDCIVAIGSGGVIPARLLKTHLKIPVIYVSVERYIHTGDETEVLARPNVIQWVPAEYVKGKNVLVVDEIYDKGVTMNFVINKLKENEVSSVDAAVLYVKKDVPGQLNSDGFTLYKSSEVDNVWVTFPWDSFL